MTPKLFTDVAMMLVNGNDPKRLAVALATYARLIGARKPTKETTIRTTSYCLMQQRSWSEGCRSILLPKMSLALSAPIALTQSSVRCPS